MLAGAIERVRSTVAPHRHDTTPTLAESLNQLRSLVDEIARREKFVDAALQLLNERLASYMQAGGALDAALKGDDIEAVRVALDKR
jgi:ABC-type transporter Mla subunit MlaD